MRWCTGWCGIFSYWQYDILYCRESPVTQLKKDYTDEFSLQLKGYQPWALVLLGWFIILIIGSFAILVLEYTIWLYTFFLIAMLLLFVPIAFRTISTLRCPACRRFMGRDVSRFCPLCGVQIRR